MRICIISSSKPHEGSGLGLTEYAYQLERHLKPLLSKNDRIDEVYALSQAQRNDMSGLIYVNTAFKKRILNRIAYAAFNELVVSLLGYPSMQRFLEP